MAPSANVIFDTIDIIGASEKAKAAGQPLSTVFSIETTARNGPNGTKYMGLYCSAGNKKGRLMLRVMGEKQVGNISPLDDADVARINADRGTKYGILTKRDRNPTMNVQKFKAGVETDDQGNLKGELPGDEGISEYFKVISLVDEFFYEEMQKRLTEGSIVVRDPRRKEYPANVTVVANAKIVPLIQTHVSMDSKTNPGAELVNPICRTNLKFDPDTGMAKKAQFYDYDKSYKDAKTGKRSFEPLTFDGHPVTAHNVHNITSHSVFSGIVNLNAVCASKMGLSITKEMEVVILQRPVARGVGLEDAIGDGMFDDDEFDDTVAEEKPTAEEFTAKVGNAAELSAEPAAAAAVAEDDLSDVIADLKV